MNYLLIKGDDMSNILKVTEERIGKAIRLFMRNDLFLLQNDSSEWTIAHKFAEYLQQQFLEWHVDIEYNREKEKTKKTIEGEVVRPDIIIHHRNTDNNLLIIEIKKSNSPEDIKLNKQRLKDFTSPNGNFRYRLGIFIIFYVEKDYRKFPNFSFYENGQEIRQTRNILWSDL